MYACFVIVFTFLPLELHSQPIKRFDTSVRRHCRLKCRNVVDAIRLGFAFILIKPENNKRNMIDNIHISSCQQFLHIKTVMEVTPNRLRL